VKAIAIAIIRGPSFATSSAVLYVQLIALESTAAAYSRAGVVCHLAA
jgi:hypothetical protein